MESLRGKRRRCAFGRVWTTLLCAVLLGATGYLDSLSSAQSVCGVAPTTPIRVDNTTELGTLRAAVNCTNGGTVEVELAGVVTLDSPIEIADGTFLSMTGEDDMAEVHGDDAQINGTRIFQVSPGGGLTLTQVKVSGGTSGEGGAIYSLSAKLALDNCVFNGNVATDGNGGAVWASGGNVTITGGEFLGNSAFRYGGAVHTTDSWLQVQGGARFEGNEASVGGALFCELPRVASAGLCSLTEAEFTSNRATFVSQDDDEDVNSSLDGGGAAAFLSADVTVTDCAFDGNYARISGGALCGGLSTNVSVNGCTFGNNTAEEDGGAISASSMTLAGGTELADNSADDDGGAVKGWDKYGTVVFNDVFCTNNSAAQNGGCFHGAGKGIFNDGAVMLNNQGIHGGSIYAALGSDMVINGGEFTCRTCERGGFLYAGDNTTVKITGGLFLNNLATRRGGAVRYHCRLDIEKGFPPFPRLRLSVRVVQYVFE